jgi:P27 family predicted phage terminase small subunit
MAGRPPTPPELRLINGNPGKRRLPRVPASPDLDAPIERPEDLPAPLVPVWDSLVADLELLGVLKRTDRQALRLTTATVHEAHELAARVQKEGAVYSRKGRDGLIKKMNPAAQLFLQYAALASRQLAEFGLTPAGRARVFSRGGKKGEDEWAEFGSAAQ